MSEPKKISFGFSKQTKKPNLLISKDSESKESAPIQLIQYLEEKAIKIIGGVEKLDEPLVIPMREPNKKLINLVDIVTNDFEVRAESEVIIEKIDDINDSKLSLDELAAKELIQDLKSGKNAEVSNKINVIPTTEKITFEGEKESTLDDYDSVPITEFGKAMLRGMGWKDGLGIGKNQEVVKVAQPSIRPKGMGLGADKLTKQAKDTKPALDRDGKALSCKKGAFVKIIAGYHKGNYGTIIGFDDESGRLNIKTALNKLNISLNEFLLTPVTRDEFNKNSKIINNAKYEEYLQKQKDKEKLEFAIKQNSKILKTEPRDSEINVKTEIISSDSDEEPNRNIKQEKHRKKYSSESDNEAYEKKRREKSRKRHERDDKSSSDEESRKPRKSEKTKYENESEEESKKTREKNRRPAKYENSDDDSKKRREKSRKSEKVKKSDSDKQGKLKYDSDSEEESRKTRKNDQETDKKDRKKYKKKKYKSDESSDESKYKRKSKKNYEEHRESRTDKDRTRERSRRDNRR